MGEIPADRLEGYMPMEDIEDVRTFDFTDIRGFKVLAPSGHKVGTVKQVFVDPNTLEPAFALLHYEKFMNWNMKNLLVPWRELRIAEDSVQTREADGHETGGHPAAASEADGARATAFYSETVVTYDTGEGDVETIVIARS